MMWAGPRPPRLPRDRGDRRLSEGRRLLLEVLRATTAAAVASACDVHPATISRLAGGKSLPTTWHLRRALELHYSIPGDSWDRPPQGAR